MTTRKQTRYNKAKEAGFLPKEARSLTKMRWTGVPYIREMLKDRRQLLTLAMLQELTLPKYRQLVKELYEDKGWMRNGKPDFFEMYRDYARKYEAEHPDYESPPRKRAPKVKRHDEFVSKYRKGLEAYDKGRGR